MSGVSKPRMLAILSAAISRAEADGLARVYIQALRDIQDILLGNTPMAAHSFWQDIVAKSDKRSVSGFAAMSPERLREVSAHGKGSFNRRQNAIEAGKRGAVGRMRNSTPEQRSEWASLGARATNEAKRNGAKHD